MHWPRGKKVKGQGHTVTNTVTVVRLLVTRAATAVCCFCRRGSAWRYDCLCFLVDWVKVYVQTTQNSSFRRRFTQPIFWLSTEETKPRRVLPPGESRWVCAARFIKVDKRRWDRRTDRRTSDQCTTFTARRGQNNNVMSSWTSSKRF